jgi:hypothetical protein
MYKWLKCNHAESSVYEDLNVDGDYVIFSPVKEDALYWHEVAHVELGTQDEYECDEFACTKVGWRKVLYSLMITYNQLRTWMHNIHEEGSIPNLLLIAYGELQQRIQVIKEEQYV